MAVSRRYLPVGLQPQFTPFPPGVEASQQDLHLFDYLRGDSLLDMGDAFNETFWSSHLLLAAKHHTVVWHACISFAALSKRARRLMTGEMETALADPDTQNLYTLALRQYHISLVHVGKMATKDNVSVADKSIILVANMLFLLCAISRGDMIEAGTLHTKGIHLIHAWKIWQPGSAAISHPFSNRHLLLFYIQLNGLFNSLSRNPNVLDWTPAVYSLQRQPFSSITDACLELEMIWTGLRGLLESGPFPAPSRMQPETHVFEDRLVFHSSIELFKARLHEFKSSPYMRASDAGLLAILEMRQILIDILLRVDMNNAELCWDQFNSQFERAISLAPRPLVEKKSQNMVCSNEHYPATPTLTISLNYIAKVCREPRVRRRVIVQMQEQRRREIMMDSRTTVAVYLHMAQLIAQLEEKAWSKPDEDVPDCRCVKEEFVCNSHRLAEFQIHVRRDSSTELVARNVHEVATGAVGLIIPIVVM